MDRMKWSNEQTKVFLEACLEEVNKVGRNGGSLHKETWVKVAAKVKEVCGLSLAQKQLKNQYDYLKAKYSGWVYLQNKTGNLYNAQMNTFNLSKEEWAEFIKGHPKAQSLKSSPLPFPDLCRLLFEGTSATGSRAYAPSSTRERTVVTSSSSSFASQTHTTQDEVNEDDEEEGPSVDKSSVPLPRPKKKSKTKVDMDELAIEMRGALRSLVAKQGPSFEDCLQKLNTLVFKSYKKKTNSLIDSDSDSDSEFRRYKKKTNSLIDSDSDSDFRRFKKNKQSYRCRFQTSAPPLIFQTWN